MPRPRRRPRLKERPFWPGDLLQLLCGVPEEVAEALIDPEPAPVETHVHNPDGRSVERRPVETLALDQVGRAQAHLALEHLAVSLVVVAERLETQQVSHPHAQLGAVHGFGEKVLGAGAQPEEPGLAVVQGRDHDDRDASW